MTEETGPPRAALRVVSGSPSAEELAVITALMAASAGEDPAPQPVRSRWADPANRMRRTLRSGPQAWVASARLR